MDSQQPPTATPDIAEEPLPWEVALQTPAGMARTGRARGPIAPAVRSRVLTEPVYPSGWIGKARGVPTDGEDD